MADIIRRMNEGENSYEFSTHDGRVISVRGNSEKEAKEKFFEYMGWD